MNNDEVRLTAAKRYYLKNRTKILEKMRTDPEVLAYRKRYDEQHKEQALARYRKNKYGLLQQVYLNMVKQQNNKCLICSKVSRLHIDHCHKSNKIRGLLCVRCNTGLGQFEDSPQCLRAAADYLEAQNVA